MRDINFEDNNFITGSEADTERRMFSEASADKPTDSETTDIDEELDKEDTDITEDDDDDDDDSLEDVDDDGTDGLDG